MGKWGLIEHYALLIWDGLGFFGFSDTKLGRLRGKKVTWLTPVLSWKSTPLLIITLIVGAYIIASESSLLGQ